MPFESPRATLRLKLGPLVSRVAKATGLPSSLIAQSEFVGAGYNGVVYRIPDQAQSTAILKLTIDRSEYVTAKRLLTMPSHPNLPRLIDTGILGPQTYFIWREEIGRLDHAQDLGLQDEMAFHYLSDASKDLSILSLEINDMDRLRHQANLARTQLKFFNETINSPQMRQLWDLVIWLAGYGLFCWDWKTRNVGVRPGTGELVLLDLGCYSSK